MIYFLQIDSPDRYIKIGTTLNLRQCMTALGRASPYHLSVLRVLPGDRQSEADLHQRFAIDHVRREWFRPSQNLLAFIAATAGECLGDDPKPEDPPADLSFRKALAAKHRADHRWRKSLEKAREVVQ